MTTRPPPLHPRPSTTPVECWCHCDHDPNIACEIYLEIIGVWEDDHDAKKY